MFHEGLSGLPSWLVVGAGLGLGGSLLIAAAFLCVQRLFGAEPNRQHHRRGGESRRRREFRGYLDAIGERYVEDHPLDGHPVAFYLPERDVAITFNPRVYYRVDRSGTHAMLAEHEMPGSVLCDRLPFETPPVEGPTDEGVPEAGPESARAAFAELGVPVGASVEEVRRAYRRKLTDVHPDQGGDEEAFKRVRDAYTTA
ncbi:MAG: J domain-containing protein, partial [Haloarculaceae archaeon]